jgi:MipA family protein
MQMNRESMSKLAVLGGVALLMSALPGVAFSQTAIVEPEEGVNIGALGVASAPDYMGSDDNEAVPAILARYYFSGRRYVQLLGPQLSLNVLDDEVWQFGPQVVFRRGRDHDVEDEIVSQMREIDDEVEGGVFAAASWRLSEDRRHRFNVRGDVQASSNGTQGTLTVSYFRPLSPTIVMNVGGGLGFSDSEWANTYFGVTGSDVALFPSLGGNSYEPDQSAGLNDYRISFGVIAQLKNQWHLIAGARYQRLLGDIADSPIVSEQGDKNQWIVGAAVGYAWQ